LQYLTGTKECEHNLWVFQQLPGNCGWKPSLTQQ